MNNKNQHWTLFSNTEPSSAILVQKTTNEMHKSSQKQDKQSKLKLNLISATLHRKLQSQFKT